MRCTLQEIARLAGDGRPLRHPDRIVETLLTDSRALVSDPDRSLFFALRTDVGDGHNFLREMKESGVRSFVVSRLPEDLPACRDCDFIVTGSPWELLRRLGKLSRCSYAGTVVSITGSQGKTTLKEYLFQALSEQLHVVRSPRSFNSRLGVPLSLWLLDDSSPVGIIEAGVSRPGEMRPLQEIISPDIALFTAIGTEHGENFESAEQLAREKALLALNAHVAICRDTNVLLLPELEKIALGNPGLKILKWSSADSDAPLLIAPIDNDCSSLRCRMPGGETFTLTTPFASDSEEDFENVASAVATAFALNLPPQSLQSGINRMRPVRTRLDMEEGVNSCKIIYDSFTPDICSLETALDFLKRRGADSNLGKTLILGSLTCDPAHEETAVGKAVRQIEAAGVTRLICVSDTLGKYAASLPDVTVRFASPAKFLSEFSTSDFSSEIILVKGDEAEMEDIRTCLEARTHETVLEVNLDAMIRNYNYFRSHLPSSTGIVAMVKASGYGAGSVEIARTLQQHGAAYLAVAVLDEGIELRQAGITMPIMVLNPKVINYKAMFAHNLEPEIYGAEMLEDVVREAAKNGLTGYPVHIKLDTGMHRMGFNAQELPALAERLRKCREIVPASVFSHLATADCPDMDGRTLLQLRRFEEYTRYLLDHCGHNFKRHILNSAGILRFPQHHYDMARLGIGLYGANTLPSDMERPLDSVSTLRTVVIAVKERAENETVGYAGKGVLTRNSRIATIPIGYADGMNRHFGNGRSKVWINGHLAPTVGNICMDACMVDVTDIPCKPGDAVEIFGPHVPVESLAEILDTIPYEILTSISPRVKRIYYRE